MKQNYLLTLFLALWCSFGYAQQQVKGIVTNEEDGEPMIGVTVLEKGTTNGTITDFDGSYELNVQSDAILEFSYTGFTNLEMLVGTQSTVSVALSPGVNLEEVTVTALGIKRSTKALNYSVSEVEGENFQESREVNIANALAGRIAGVNVSNIASGPAGSTRVIIRGNSSLEGGNQPLYVIDGVPMDNSGFGQAGIWGGRDEGDGMSSVNPDDIETLTVLKGANAAALYGSRAANGVIMITTKSGAGRKGIGIEVRSNYTFDQINDLREYQTTHGQGGFVSSDPSNPDSERIAVAPRTQAEGYNWNAVSWGPRLGTGNFVGFDGVTRPYVDAGNNYDRYYRTGATLTNSLALSGGSDTQNFRFSVADLRNTSIIPNSGFNRLNASLSANSKFADKITLSTTIMYSHEEADNRPYLSDSPANGILAMYYLPTNANIDWYKGDPNKLGAVAPNTDDASLLTWQKSAGEELPAGNNNWHQNPWWTAYQFDNDDTRDRLIASSQIKYDITDWLYVQGRVGMDWFTRRETDLVPQGTGYQRGGSIGEGENRVRETNFEWMVGVNKSVGKFSLNAFGGGNRMRSENERLSLSGSGFNVPFFEVINNTVTRNFGYGYSARGINSLFGSAEIGYNGYLYLTGTVRNDWFSVLNAEFNDVLYPSVGLSFVFSDAIKNLPRALSFGKLRASWAQVGNATLSPYETNLTYSLNNAHLNYTLASFSSSTIPNPFIQPLTSTELEFGLDLRFFGNRLGLDLTYYHQKTTDDILNATISATSGFPNTFVNVGEMQNQGVEVLITGTPIRGALTWDISLNLAKNENKVISLIEGADELSLEEPRTRTVFTKHIVGLPYGMITGLVQKRSPSGELVFDANNGAPIQSDGYEIIGNGVADWTGGINNNFTFKNFNAAFLIDFKIGGDIYSGTNVRLTGVGLTDWTVQGREGETPISVSGVAQTGTADDGSAIYEPFSKTLNPSEARNYWIQTANRVQDFFVYDASFVKLRSISFGYSFPKKFLSKTPLVGLKLSFVGRNLAILHKNTPNIDPESSYNNNNGGQGLDYFGFPATRSYGFDIKASF